MIRNVIRTYIRNGIYKHQQQQYHNSVRSSLARVLATDGVDEICAKILQQNGHQVDVMETLPEDQLIIDDYDGLVVRSN